MINSLENLKLHILGEMIEAERQTKIFYGDGRDTEWEVRYLTLKEIYDLIKCW